MTSTPEYVVTNLKVVEDRGDYFRLEFGTLDGPVIVDMAPAAFHELTRRLAQETRLTSSTPF
jgi:hypothetical protein